MRENLPITQQEHILPDGSMLVSKTDLKGRITFANEAFVDASGFSMTELLGKAHNIVRHPDMPEEAFYDLWQTLKAGRPWTALVKNRRKSGDFYWVVANATPILEAGVVTGYMSVRSKPSREQVQAAAAAYRPFREKRAHGLAIHEGKVVKSGIAQRLDIMARASLGQQALGVGVLSSAPAAGMAALLFVPAAGVPVRMAIAGATASLGAAGLFYLWRLIGVIVRTLRASAAQVDELTQGSFDRIFEANGEDELAGLQRSLQALRTKVGFELADGRRLAVESTRIRQALDVAVANVMVADASYDIIYANASLMRTLAAAEADIRQVLPTFSVANIVGSNIDQFHSRPAHQRELLSRLTATHQTRLSMGARRMDMVITPVQDSAGMRIGTVVEWTDRTQELALQEQERATRTMEIATVGQIDTLVSAAVRGDLTQRVDVAGMTGFFASVANGLNGLLDTMSELVFRIKAAAAQVRGGADEISRGNLDLSQRTEEQASALEETASSMEQMAASAKLSADNAELADDLAGAARTQAETGGGIVSETAVAMAGISASSNQISSIIGVIDEIAFQTNLLALNAAVEAARAGEQGRGFAVVAAEVRTLASRSATAAREIKALIDDSVSKVVQGTSLVDRSGRALVDIMGSVNKVTGIVVEMSAASREQSAGIEQVNKAVMSLDSVTQQNAALVEQAAAAAQSLLDQAANLDEMMAKYKVHGAAGHAAGEPRRQPRSAVAARGTAAA